MIDEIILMNGYGLYVWSSFAFTLFSFATLYTLVKINLVKEQNKFYARLNSLKVTKVRLATAQSTNRDILASTLSSKI